MSKTVSGMSPTQNSRARGELCKKISRGRDVEFHDSSISRNRVVKTLCGHFHRKWSHLAISDRN